MARYRTMWALALAVEMSSWSQAGVGDLLSGQWLRTKLERLGWHPIRPGKLRPAESIGARATRRVLAPERRGSGHCAGEPQADAGRQARPRSEPDSY